MSGPHTKWKISIESAMNVSPMKSPYTLLKKLWRSKCNNDYPQLSPPVFSFFRSVPFRSSGHALSPKELKTITTDGRKLLSTKFRVSLCFRAISLPPFDLYFIRRIIFKKLTFIFYFSRNCFIFRILLWIALPAKISLKSSA